MNKEVSILIGNCRTWESIELVIESLIQRTAYKPYQIIVHNQARIRDKGNRVAYLNKMARNGYIRLIEGEYRPRSDLDGHGKSVKKLLSVCETELALLWVSDIEILEPDWLDMLVDRMQGDRILGVADFKPGRNHFDRMWIAPRYLPDWMLLDMERYREIEGDDDWDLSYVPFPEWPYPEVFIGQSPPSNPDHNPPEVFRDTGWRIWEKITHENPDGYRFVPLPGDWFGKKIHHFGGIDRNSFRPEFPELQTKLAKIRGRLEALREEG